MKISSQDAQRTNFLEPSFALSHIAFYNISTMPLPLLIRNLQQMRCRTARAGFSGAQRLFVFLPRRRAAYIVSLLCKQSLSLGHLQSCWREEVRKELWVKLVPTLYGVCAFRRWKVDREAETREPFLICGVCLETLFARFLPEKNNDKLGTIDRANIHSQSIL